jgi:FixJ family two-component response regulator
LSPEGTGAAYAKAGANIMIVDDSEALTRALAAVLKLAGYQPTTFANGQDALAHAEESKPAAAIIDIHLPDLSGLVLSRLLRARLGPEMPIIVLSGDGSMEVLNSLSHVGATYFFQKPVSADTLLNQLRELAI